MSKIKFQINSKVQNVSLPQRRKVRKDKKFKFAVSLTSNLFLYFFG